MQSAKNTAAANSMCSSTSTRPLLLLTILTVVIATTPNAPTALRSESPNGGFTPHEDFDISIIWQNLDVRSDFSIIRKESRGPIERIMVDFAKVLESGLFEVVSVNASKHLFCVTVYCEKNRDEGVRDEIWKVL
jgi:hypothetical protein